MEGIRICPRLPHAAGGTVLHGRPDGGLYGGANDPSKNLWFLLDKFPGADLIAFNTYPGMIYKTPSEIPADYFTGIKAHTKNYYRRP
jgi:hypothetical protein